MFAFYDKITGAFQIQGEGLVLQETEKKLTAALGVYTQFTYNKEKKTLETKEEYPGGKAWIYMMDEGNRIYFSSSLRTMKEKRGVSFVLNEGILPHFMYNGFLYGKHTLVCGVFKLEPGICLIFDRERIYRQVISYSYDEAEVESYEENYQRVLEDAIRKSMEHQLRIDKKVNLTLSAGYDSNCILHIVKKYYPDEMVNAYTIGGYKGVNEIENAKKIAAFYQDVNLRIGMVTPDTLEALEDMVERLEGGVYERGIFLQYELAKLLKKSECKSIICGECADQIFNKNYYAPVQQDNFLFDYENHPKQMGAYVVKKKNELMLNSFGIEVQYPFLEKQLRHMAYLLRHKNGIGKTFHIQMCKNWFPKSVLSYVEKKGGSTDLEALFETNGDIAAAMKKSPFFSEEYHITEKYPREEAERDYYLTLKYVELFKKRFCD